MDHDRAELESVLVSKRRNKDNAATPNESTLDVASIELVKKQLREMESLKAEMHDLQCRFTDVEIRLGETQSDLKDTRVLLDAVSSNKKQENISPSLSRTQIVVKTSIKRARSPSLEIIETTSKRVKGKEKKPELIPPEKGLKPETLAQALVPHVSVPTRSSKINVSESANSKANLIEANGEKGPSKKPLLEAELPLNMSTLPQLVANMYLRSAETLEIAPPPLETEFPRAFLRLSYGGSDQEFPQYIQSSVNPSGPKRRNFVFPMQDLNPCMASVPGAPGLVFASRHEILSDPPWTMFCQHSKAKELWLYLGEYECTLVGRLTPLQFRCQPPTVQMRWADLIINEKKDDIYIAMRARIVLQRDGVIPIIDKRREEEIIQGEVQAIKSGKGRKISRQHIIYGFWGEQREHIDIIRMICVNYDHVFANNMNIDFVNHNNPVPSVKKKNVSTVQSNPKRISKSRGAMKRKVATFVESKSDSDTDAYSTPSPPPRKQSQRKACRKVSAAPAESESDLYTSLSDDDPTPPLRQRRQRKASRKLLESRGQ